MKTKLFILIAAIAALSLPSVANAVSVVSGTATIDYDQTAWNTLAANFGTPPILTLSAFYDQAQANALTAAQVLSNPQIGASYTGEVYAMNGSIVTNLAGRTTQPTTFDFNPSDPTLSTGSIGLGGITRFAVAPAAGGGSLLYGDFTLQYSATRIGLGGTGWYLKGNIPPAAAAFDLLNVNIVESPGSFTISGDLGVSYEVANYLYATPSDTLKDVGNFTFTGYTACRNPPRSRS